MAVVGLVQLPPFPDGRAETGPIRFGDDWPGIFIRGDEALMFARVLHRVADHMDDGWLDRAMIRGLAETLQSCSVGDTGWPP